MSAPAKIPAGEKIQAGKVGTFLFRISAVIALLAGAASLGLTMTGGATWGRFLHAYLIGYAWVVSIALGCLFFVLIHHLTRARWSVVMRRLAECVTAAFPVVFVLGFPIVGSLLAGNDDLYYWSHHDAHNAQYNHHIHVKAGWLSPAAFAVRFVIYFVIWTATSYYFAKKSREQDETGDAKISDQLRVASGPAVIVYALSICFFAFDFLMSLAPKWYSTIYGVNYFGGAMIGLYAFLSLLAMFVQSRGVLLKSVTTEHYHDMGKMLFAFTFFWAYTAFSQFMLYWYGNIPEETVWYNYRFFNNWQYWSIAVTLGHWAFPFLFLLSRWTKRIQPAFIFFCVWQLVFHWVDLYWNVMPNYNWGAPQTIEGGVKFIAGPLTGEVASHAINFSIVDVTTAVAVIALFVAAVGRALKGNLVPVKDPNLALCLGHENF